MPSFRLTQDAETDLLEIWRYSYEKWNEEQADQYLDNLEEVCGLIGTDKILTRSMPEIRPNLYFAMCRHHFVFWLHRSNQDPVVIAFLHEKRNIVRHLRDRFDLGVGE